VSRRWEEMDLECVCQRLAGARMFTAVILRVRKQNCQSGRFAHRSVVAHLRPEASGLGLAATRREHRRGCVVGTLSFWRRTSASKSYRQILAEPPGAIPFYSQKPIGCSRLVTGPPTLVRSEAVYLNRFASAAPGGDHGISRIAHGQQGSFIRAGAGSHGELVPRASVVNNA
jgi:hypothetical protein